MAVVYMHPELTVSCRLHRHYIGFQRITGYSNAPLRRIARFLHITWISTQLLYATLINSPTQDVKKIATFEGRHSPLCAITVQLETISRDNTYNSPVIHGFYFSS
jgi:hypothetical protein